MKTKLDHIVAWQPGPREIPTHVERFQMVLRLCRQSTTSEVVLYAHGTAVVRSTLGSTDLYADDLMQSFDVPDDGAGGPLGDICPTTLDDGSAIFIWQPPDPTLGFAVSVLTADELAAHRHVLYAAGTLARQLRGRDARSLARCMTWRAA